MRRIRNLGSLWEVTGVEEHTLLPGEGNGGVG